jgi:hypothetical protein
MIFAWTKIVTMQIFHSSTLTPLLQARSLACCLMASKTLLRSPLKCASAVLLLLTKNPLQLEVLIADPEELAKQAQV